MNGAAVEVRALNKWYGGGENRFHALKNVDLTVRAGEFVMLEGPSGSGKTTLLSVLGCVLSTSGGSVRLFGDEVSGRSESELPTLRLSYIGFIFQGYNLIASLTARENVAAILRLRGFRTRDALDEAESLLERVGLADKLESRPEDLSGGQRQRVAIARALAGKPPLILADEPTASLDAQTGLHVTELLRQTCRELGHTAVVVTHDNRIFHLADRIVHIEDGADSRRRVMKRRRVPWSILVSGLVTVIVVLLGVGSVRSVLAGPAITPHANDLHSAARTAVPNTGGRDERAQTIDGDWVGGNGVVEPAQRESRLASPVPGRIQHILVHEGQFVQQGDVLVELDSAPERAALAAAQADVEVSRAELQRTLRGLRREDVDAAIAEAESAHSRALLSSEVLQRNEALARTGAVTADELDRARRTASADDYHLSDCSTHAVAPRSPAHDTKTSWSHAHSLRHPSPGAIRHRRRSIA